MAIAFGEKYRVACDFLIGFFLYVSTLYFSSNALLLIVLLLIFIKDFDFSVKRDFNLVFLFVVTAFANLALHLSYIDFSRHLSSFAIPLVFLMAVLAPRINVQSFKVFVFFTCFEILIGLVEFQMGTVAIFSGQLESSMQPASIQSDLLYDLRVFGLSSNSSLLAEKVFLSIILVMLIPNFIRNKWLVLSLLLLGLILSFNRTAILATVVYFLLLAFSQKFSIRRIAFFFLLTLLALLLAFQYYDFILVQLLRSDSGELTHSELSRLYFWEKASEVFMLNPLQGNGSLTFRVDDPVTGIPQHAHNSFVMLLSTHGLLASVFLLLYIVVRTMKANWRVVAVFSLFSMTQYFIFWNLSVPDMIFFWVLGCADLNHRRDDCQ